MLVGHQAVDPAAFKRRQNRRTFVLAARHRDARALVLADIVAGDHSVDFALHHAAFGIDKASHDLAAAAACGQLIHLRLIDKAIFEDGALGT